MANLDAGGGGGPDPQTDPGTPPAPAPPPSKPPYSPPYGSNAPAAKHAAAATPSAPVDHTWDGIPSGYKTELEDLALQWQQIDGFQVMIGEDTLRHMADAHVVTMRDLGQWMLHFGGSDTASKIGNRPWLYLGLDQSSWRRQVGDYQDAMERYTGQRPDFNFDPNTLNGTDAFSQAVFSGMTQGLTQAGFTEKLLHDENIRNQYGWIKYGLTYDDFQQKKTDMRVTFGQDLSNDQAILQLQYLHQAQGASRQVTAPAPSGGQAPPPAISEVEVR